jgi:small nuclear ribonucleoprotein G
MERRIAIKLNAGRKVVGVLRGFDPFMNIVLEEADEFLTEQSVTRIGMVVIRGSSILQMECLE